MATVQTVLGPIDSSELGPTLVHEHVRICYPGDSLDPAYSFDREACIATAVERMAGLAHHGVRTFVDPCPIDLGRDPELLAEVARQSRMQIVCSTGFYLEHIGIPYYWRVRSPEEVAEFYLHEINDGIGETGIKPGCIKIAWGDPPGDHDRKKVPPRSPPPQNHRRRGDGRRPVRADRHQPLRELGGWRRAAGDTRRARRRSL